MTPENKHSLDSRWKNSAKRVSSAGITTPRANKTHARNLLPMTPQANKTKTRNFSPMSPKAKRPPRKLSSMTPRANGIHARNLSSMDCRNKIEKTHFDRKSSLGYSFDMTPAGT